MLQKDLFASTPEIEQLPLSQASVRFFPDFLSCHEAEYYFQDFLKSLAWRQDKIKLYGKEFDIPRLQAWYGDPHCAYEYSNLTMNPLPWTRELLELKDRCEAIAKTNFNSVLANLYRDGQDSMGFHSDDEPELGREPIIVSLSLGQPRDFIFKKKYSSERFKLLLESGSLLIMSGQTQANWQHGIAKSRKPLEPRINLTFRYILSDI